KMLNGLLKQGNHLVTRLKANAVAYAPAPRKKGRKTVLAAHHSSRHPAIGVCRGQSAAPDTSRISHGSCKKRLPHEIHRRAAGHAKHANFPLGFVSKNRDS